jgi:hypothetical protein
MAEMTQQSDIHMMLGEMRGQMREVVHGMNNASQKIDALTREVVEIKGMAATVAALEVRVTALERAKNRQEGALSLGEWVIKIVPMAVLGAAFAAAVKLLGIVP